MWDAIIYPFPNFNDYTVEIWKSKYMEVIIYTLYRACDYLSAH